jgi:hypothetical protein
MSISAQWGALSGGSSLEVTGAGFNSTDLYVCAFTGQSPASSTQATEIATPISATKVVCSVPQWNDGPGTVVFTLQYGNGVAVAQQGGGDVLFTFTSEQWTSATPLASHTLGGSQITFTGSAFDVSSTDYRAQFATAQHVVSGNCTAVTHVSMICEIPSFPGLSQTARLTLIKGGITVAQATATVAFDFAPSWSVMQPTKQGSVHGGTTITLSGTAFVASTDRYHCVWTGVTLRAGVRPFVSAAAEAISDKQVVCTSPPWPGIEDTTVLSITKTDGLQRRVFFTGPQGGSFFEYYSNLEKVYADEATASSGASSYVVASAAGGTSITVVGQGFKSDTSVARTCRFTCVEAVCAGTFVESAAVAPSSTPGSTDLKLISCVFPAWPHRLGSFRGIRSRVEVFRSDGISYPGAPGFIPWVTVTRSSWNSGISITAFADGGTLITITGTGFCYSGSSCANAFKCKFTHVDDSAKVAYSKQVRA